MIKREDFKEIIEKANEALDNFEVFQINGATIERLKTPGAHTYVTKCGERERSDKCRGRILSSFLLYLQLEQEGKL